MARTDWLPHSHKALNGKATRSYRYLLDLENRERMGFGPATPYGEWFSKVFMPNFLTYSAVFEAWLNPAERTPLKMDALADAEKEFVPLYRQLYSGMLKGNPLVTNVDLDAMDLPKRSEGGRTSSPVSNTYPGFSIDSGTIRRLIISYFDKKSRKRKSKPEGQHGVEIRWAILLAPPADIDELRNSSFDTRSPFVLDFEESERGETVYVCLRWENTRGEKGPWSGIQSAIIP
jgi:hypothetical protein